mmetsp:Transcript_119164/g.178040  ORF Transcript_119164/g.178040 Transcript_119164/m.178040 type:complete len:127 (+) Transcript_119164:13-393(+)|eukprot:CAMPEP_0117045818 /NCGR_PEP_ID=MMETSP0472-20121206/31703_1 /TAXON_ID=693140 ORGANISM="Tiarina fusus, Strain LIS" /NCGR_SAMPLE_ID=MMETSP0472 /ASSEMBLY_ACC=CAM_ASM_000603 /LENGTH=126 /DNA_ID=CAMNT_0004757977 /DNA_START=13 /DNA_END=393 /DNA_ORIENTATION=-
MTDQMEVGLFDCCAEPGGAGRCLFVYFCNACGCPAGSMAEISGKSYWMWCLISALVPFGGIVAHCCVLPQAARETMGVEEPGCCSHCLTQTFCLSCNTCRILNEYDRRARKGMIKNPAAGAASVAK